MERPSMPDDREKRLTDEIQFHIDMATEKNMRMGMSADEARRRANVQFGAREHHKDEARDQFRRPFFSDLKKDIRHALRSLRRHKGFAATVTLTLGLGIGASTAIFSVVNAVLLRPLPYADAGRLTLIWGDMRARHVTDFPFAPFAYRQLKENSPAFQDIGAVTPFNAPFQVKGEEPEQVKGLGVTQNFLPILGVRVIAGRDFTDEDAQAPPPPPQLAPGSPLPAPGAAVPAPPPAMLMLSYGFWQRRFGGDKAVLGKTVAFGGGQGQVVGVLPADFELLFPPNTNMESHPDVIVCQRIDYERASKLNVFMRLVGRLKP